MFWIMVLNDHIDCT